MALKYSRQRESIKMNLVNRSDHPTADMVYADIKKIYPNVSLGTVYRNLALLSDLGEINKLGTLTGADRYDGNIKPHNHFMCRSCGCVQDMEDLVTDAVMERAEAGIDGVIDACSVTFYGLCTACIPKVATV